MSEVKDEDLYDYVLGLCDKRQEVIIEQQLQKSPELQSQVAALRDTLALPALDIGPVDVSDSLFSSIQNSIGGSVPFGGFVDRLAEFLDLPRVEVSAILGDIQQENIGLSRSGIPGITQVSIKAGPARSGNECQLIRMAPRARFPSHGHLAEEWGFVIQGEVTEYSGEIYRPGDIVHRSPGETHSFISTGSIPFMFFVIHGGIQFDNQIAESG